MMADAQEMKPISLMGRCFLAVALMVGFYLVAVLFVLALVALPLLPLLVDKVVLWLFIGCWSAAFWLFLAILPRWKRWKPCGVRLTEKDSPGLFAMMRKVAEKTGEAEPSEVWLDHEMNAYVTQRGGMWGFGGKRVMGVGLALLEVLTPQEVEAVLAHEFGHYSGGDTKFSAWLCRTQESVVRAFQAMEGRSLQAVFEFVGNLFFKITHAVSRRQEFLADKVAAETAGVHTFAAALAKLEVYGQWFSHYFEQDWMAFLGDAYVPRLMPGFRQLLAQDEVRHSLMKPMSELATEEAMAEEEANQYATHPSLRQRLAALGIALDAVTATEDSGRRLVLVDREALEHKVTESVLAPRTDGLAWRHVAWETLFESTYVALWLQNLAHFPPVLRGLRMRDLALVARDKGRLFHLFAPAMPNAAPTDDFFSETLNVLGAAAVLAMWRKGCKVELVPRYGVAVFFGEGKRVFPVMAMFTFFGGGTVDAWHEACAVLGIEDETFDEVTAMVCSWNALKAGYLPVE